MTQENNVSSLQQHLVGGDVSALEVALNLEATVGFPYSNYKYYDYDWESEGEYYDFLSFANTAPSVSGRFYNSQEETAYETTIILYKDKYYVQVEKDFDHISYSSYYTNSFEDYKSAVKYAYDIVFND